MSTSLPEPGHSARIVVTGVDENGRSRVQSDADSDITYQSPFAKAIAVWETKSFPLTIGDDFAPEFHDEFDPESGMRIFTTVFAPEKDWGADESIVAASMGEVGLGDIQGDRPAGFHTTETVDIQIVLDGEIFLLLDDEDVLLRAGDTVVMQGVPHAWRNRSDAPTTVLAVMIAADRN